VFWYSDKDFVEYWERTENYGIERITLTIRDSRPQIVAVPTEASVWAVTLQCIAN
jgi:hypothetical protein